MAEKLILTHPEWGIFLGHAMGLAFWSLLDTAGQFEAPVFDSIDDAKEIIALLNQHKPEQKDGEQPIRWEFTLSYITVANPSFATVDDLINAGRKHQLGDMESNRDSEAREREQRT